MDLIDEEITFVRENSANEFSGLQVIGCHRKLITLIIMKTKYKKLTVSIQFPDDYPNSLLFVELKSKVISQPTLQQIMKSCQNHLNYYLGSKQISPLLKYLTKLLDESPLLPCKDELTQAKNEFFKNSTNWMKLKQREGCVVIESKQDQYFFKFTLKVPNEYPEKPIEIKSNGSNLPAVLAYYFTCQAIELARKSVEAPLNKQKRKQDFEPKPHVYNVIKFLIHDCIQTHCLAVCPLCSSSCLPPDPKDVIEDDKDDKFVERIYCGHLYHHGCLSSYMKTPPFQNKKCLVCKAAVHHYKFRIPPVVAERRWANEQARNRELDEVTDFLS